MSHYRLYFLNAASGHIESASDIEASDDAEAVDAASMLVSDRPAEIWSGTRKVGRCVSPSMARAEQVRSERAAAEFQSRRMSHAEGPLAIAR